MENNNEQQAGNKYPIQMSTVYPGIWIEIQSDNDFLYALDNKSDMARNLLVRKFFPDASPEEVREVVCSLSLTGVNADEYGKVEEYADRKKRIELLNSILETKRHILENQQETIRKIKVAILERRKIKRILEKLLISMKKRRMKRKK